MAVAPAGADPFELLESLPVPEARPESETADAAAAVGGGWFGYLGYGLGARIEPLDPPPPPGGPSLPPFSLAFYDHLLRLDASGQWWFEALLTAAREPVIRARLDDFRNRIPTSPASCPSNAHLSGATWTAGEDGPRGFSTKPWRFTPSPLGHRLAVAACRERIHAGDLYQANICQRLHSRLKGDPLDLFATAAAKLKPDRAAYLAGPWGAVASLSPELFLERHGSRVRTAPIKGTRPRPEEPAAAAAEREKLAASEKDRAENQMIVDMARNDLGRVCRYGTVRVDALAEPRAHAGVWHLVSEISGELDPGHGDRDLLRATFPPASVTGAPKIAAQNVIAELESTRREVYTGAIGFAGPLAGLELSVAIRSFEFGSADPEPGRGRTAWLGVGGGIVADSDPAAEAEECLTKASPLLRAIGAEPAPIVPPAPAARNSKSPRVRPLRHGPRPIPRPDPEAGIFETIRIEDKEPLHLDLHLDRLATSAAELYDIALPAGLAGEIRATAALVSDPAARLRVDLDPTGQATILTSPLPAPRSTDLAPVCLPGGLGPHKWSDRAALDRLTEAVHPHIPLLCDLDGQVLEAAHATLFADLGDGRLATPPLDGRILPGIARALLIGGETALPTDVATVVEAPLTLAELVAARAIYLANALRPQLRPANLVDPADATASI